MAAPSQTDAILIPPPPPEKPAPPAVASATTLQAPTSVAPTVNVGAYAVQLGAFKDMATANAQWQKLQTTYPAQLGPLSAKVDQVDVQGKGTLYRLKGGYVSQAQAKTICDALKAQNTICLVAPK